MPNIGDRVKVQLPYGVDLRGRAGIHPMYKNRFEARFNGLDGVIVEIRRADSATGTDLYRVDFSDSKSASRLPWTDHWFAGMLLVSLARTGRHPAGADPGR